MRYFTRQLYQAFNSPDDRVADRADEAWEAAIREYRKHLDGIRDRVPANVLKLSELDLHDAEVLSRVEDVQPGGPPNAVGSNRSLAVASWSAVAIVTVRRGDDLVSLIYGLWDHVREHPAPDDWPFSRRNEHWLYDEVDGAQDGPAPFVHRILFSSGVELEIPFVTVVIHRFPAHTTSEGAGKKRTA